MKIYTAAEMREHEQMAVDKGTTFEQLMENAGRAAAADLLRRRPQAGRVLIVCGKGNNGGDGLVMARILQAHGWRVDILFAAGEKLSELAELKHTAAKSSVWTSASIKAAQYDRGRLKIVFQTASALPRVVFYSFNASSSSDFNHSSFSPILISSPRGTGW